VRKPFFNVESFPFIPKEHLTFYEPSRCTVVVYSNNIMMETETRIGLYWHDQKRKIWNYIYLLFIYIY